MSDCVPIEETRDKIWKNDDTLTMGSGSVERSIVWTIKNIREHSTGNLYNCGVCEEKVMICDLESDGQDSITIYTSSIPSFVERCYKDGVKVNACDNEDQTISFWKKDINNPLRQNVTSSVSESKSSITVSQEDIDETPDEAHFEH